MLTTYQGDFVGICARNRAEWIILREGIFYMLLNVCWVQGTNLLWCSMQCVLVCVCSSIQHFW